MLWAYTFDLGYNTAKSTSVINLLHAFEQLYLLARQETRFFRELKMAVVHPYKSDLIYRTDDPQRHAVEDFYSELIAHRKVKMSNESSYWKSSHYRMQRSIHYAVLTIYAEARLPCGTKVLNSLLKKDTLTTWNNTLGGAGYRNARY